MRQCHWGAAGWLEMVAAVFLAVGFGVPRGRPGRLEGRFAAAGSCWAAQGHRRSPASPSGLAIGPHEGWLRGRNWQGGRSLALGRTGPLSVPHTQYLGQHVPHLRAVSGGRHWRGWPTDSVPQMGSRWGDNQGGEKGGVGDDDWGGGRVEAESWGAAGSWLWPAGMVALAPAAVAATGHPTNVAPSCFKYSTWYTCRRAVALSIWTVPPSRILDTGAGDELDSLLPSHPDRRAEMGCMDSIY